MTLKFTEKKPESLPGNTLGEIPYNISEEEKKNKNKILFFLKNNGKENIENFTLNNDYLKKYETLITLFPNLRVFNYETELSENYRVENSKQKEIVIDLFLSNSKLASIINTGLENNNLRSIKQLGLFLSKYFDNEEVINYFIENNLLEEIVNNKETDIDYLYYRNGTEKFENFFKEKGINLNNKKNSIPTFSKIEKFIIQNPIEEPFKELEKKYHNTNQCSFYDQLANFIIEVIFEKDPIEVGRKGGGNIHIVALEKEALEKILDYTEEGYNLEIITKSLFQYSILKNKGISCEIGSLLNYNKKLGNYK